MKQEYSFKCLSYQEKNGSFTAVCLDLDIVEEQHQTLEEAVLSLNDAIETHVKAAAQLDYPKELLYRPAPEKYWKKLEQLSKRGEKPIFLPRPMQLFNSTATISSSIIEKIADFQQSFAF